MGTIWPLVVPDKHLSKEGIQAPPWQQLVPKYEGSFWPDSSQNRGWGVGVPCKGLNLVTGGRSCLLCVYFFLLILNLNQGCLENCLGPFKSTCHFKGF